DRRRRHAHAGHGAQQGPGRRRHGERRQRSWRATWTLTPGVSYSVAATATGASGRTTAVSTSFRTKTVHNGLSVSAMTPSAGTKVGVGMPVTVTFNRPVRDKAAVER